MCAAWVAVHRREPSPRDEPFASEGRPGRMLDVEEGPSAECPIGPASTRPSPRVSGGAAKPARTWGTRFLVAACAGPAPRLAARIPPRTCYVAEVSTGIRKRSGRSVRSVLALVAAGCAVACAVDERSNEVLESGGAGPGVGGSSNPGGSGNAGVGGA